MLLRCTWRSQMGLSISWFWGASMLFGVLRRKCKKTFIRVWGYFDTYTRSLPLEAPWRCVVFHHCSIIWRASFLPLCHSKSKSLKTKACFSTPKVVLASWANGLFKPYIGANQTFKSFCDTASSGYNLPPMVVGVHPPYGSSLHNFLQRRGPKPGTILPNHGRWWQKWLHASPWQFKRYFATQPLVEDGIPRFRFWHYHEHGLHLVQKHIKVFKGYMGHLRWKRYCLYNLSVLRLLLRCKRSNLIYLRWMRFYLSVIRHLWRVQDLTWGVITF